MINAIAQEMFKMFSAQQQGGTSGSSSNKMTNFAGMILASNTLSICQEYDKNAWIIDSGSSDHTCGNEALFCELKI